jgi:hypothetical protein
MNDYSQLAIVLLVFVSPALFTLAGLCLVAHALLLREHCQNIEDRINETLDDFCTVANRGDELEMEKFAKRLKDIGVSVTHRRLPRPTHRHTAGLQ